MCLTAKCRGILFLVAGILLGLVAFNYLSLTLFFAILLIIFGLHGLTCKDCQALGRKKK